MSNGRRVKLEHAVSAARTIVERIGPCLRPIIAGSIRRGLPEVGDIEIVVQSPKEYVKPVVNRMINNGYLEPRGDMRSMHRFYKLIAFPDTGPIKVDLFVAESRFELPIMLWQRTGPHRYTRYIYSHCMRKRCRICDSRLWWFPKEDWEQAKQLDSKQLASAIHNEEISAMCRHPETERDLYSEAFIVPYTPPCDRNLQILSEQLQILSEIDQRRSHYAGQ